MSLAHVKRSLPELLVHKRLSAAQAQSAPDAGATDSKDDVPENLTVHGRTEADGEAINLVSDAVDVHHIISVLRMASAGKLGSALPSAHPLAGVRSFIRQGGRVVCSCSVPRLVCCNFQQLLGQHT